VTVRLVITDPALELPVPAAVERRSIADGLDPGPWAPHEVLVVSAEVEVLAEAARRGWHRLLPTSPAATATAVTEVCAFLERP
jgi:hypothetical protein